MLTIFTNYFYLAVTIIVIIILAGVSINAILGENGIITIAKQAKENMQLAQEKEQTKLNELYTQIKTDNRTTEKTSNRKCSSIKCIKRKNIFKFKWNRLNRLNGK